MLGINDVQNLVGRTVYSTGGDKIGDIRQVYLNDRTEEPEFFTVETGMLGSNENFVPVAEAQVTEDKVTVPYDKDKVKNAPDVAPDGHISEEQEQQLHAYYGLTGGADYDRDRDRTDVDGAVGHDTSGPTTDDAMTRSEEELTVGKTSRETGRVRLRKYVVTEDVQKTVPVQREEVRLEREPITDANVGKAMDGPAISDEEHEVVLHEEEVVAEKRAVPKERVRLDKDTVAEERTVSEEVRKERIDEEGDVSR